MEWFEQFIEVQQFGWNPTFIGGLGIAFFAFVGAAMLIKQNYDVWHNKSGKSVSITWTSYFLCMQMVVFFYGWEIKSLALLINGITRGVIYIPLLIGLNKFKRFSRRETWQMVLFITAALIMLAVPFKQIYFLFFSIGFALATVSQPLELYRVKEKGVLNIWMIVIFLMANIFWMMYGFTLGDWALIVLNTPLFVLFVITIALWLKYPKSEL